MTEEHFTGGPFLRTGLVLLMGITTALSVSIADMRAHFAPHPAAPPCPTHDNRAYHSLWDAERGCHYDHHHGDDPHTVDDLFGTHLYELMGGEISHPWQTFSNQGYENDTKHAGYFWHVRRDLPCPQPPGCITAFRVLVHQHPSGRDAPVRFHSGVLEAALLDTESGREGFIQIPGVWLDFGDLHVDGQVVIDEQGNGNRHKQHQSSGTPQIIWYGASQGSHTPNRRGDTPQGFIRVSTTVHDTWEYTDPADPGRSGNYACHGQPRCRANATVLRPHLITVSIPRDLRSLVDPDRDGRADWSGFTDRYGVPTQDCVRASRECVPVTLSGLTTTVGYACDQVCARSFRDYDIYFDNRPSGWSQPVP